MEGRKQGQMNGWKEGYLMDRLMMVGWMDKQTDRQVPDWLVL